MRPPAGRRLALQRVELVDTDVSERSFLAPPPPRGCARESRRDSPSKHGKLSVVDKSIMGILLGRSP